MKAKSIKGKSPEEISRLVDSSCTSDFKPALAVAFLPNKKDVRNICSIFNERDIKIFGASSFGQFIDSEYDTDSIVVMLMEIHPDSFRIEFRETGNSSTEEIAKSIGEGAKTAFNRPAFIVASGGIKTNGEKIVEGIQKATGKDTAIFGGLAASDLETMYTFVFTNENYSNDGLVALVLDGEKISVTGYATGGSQPIGMFHTITKSEDNVVYTIDDEPALDLILRYSGNIKTSLKEETGLLNIASAFQIQLQRENASPIMRTPMYANLDEKSVVFAGSLPEGSRVKFCTLPGFEVVENVIFEFSKYRKNAADADAMVLFSCQGREIAFGPYMKDEIERLKKLWDSPMIGLFSFGEIGPGPEGRTEFYNLTCSLALLKEVA
jgi:hypothetical protein